MTRPKLLDLFCGAGGCAVGYHRAGFDVVGVDNRPQPRYPFPFVQADALQPPFNLREFDAIHASPPCQAHVKGLAAVNQVRGRELRHEDLIPAIRRILVAIGRPYVIENVEGSTLRTPVRICGTAFGLPIRRHRRFESNVLLFGKDCEHWRFKEAKYYTSYRPHKKGGMSTVVQVYGRPGRGAMKDWPAAMGIDWMSNHELSQAIPPAYTEYIGKQLLQVIR
jgi:DNA (cytosine-5)-methyltransferase 1